MLKPGESMPARYVGDFPDSSAAWDACTQPADVATFTGPDGTRYVMIWCAICGEEGRGDSFRVKPKGSFPLRPQSGWEVTSTDPINLEPSFKLTHYTGAICHYFVHGGRFQALSDSTPRT